MLDMLPQSSQLLYLLGSFYYYFHFTVGNRIQRGQVILLRFQVFGSNFRRSSYSFSKYLSSNLGQGIVQGSWDITINKIEKAPVTKELEFYREGE